MSSNLELSNSEQKNSMVHSETKQFSSFYLDNKLYGIEVNRVQEVVRSMLMTTIPLAPDYVRGLINLRGQVATAIGLRHLFGFLDSVPNEFINIVCKLDGMLISFQVDEIGDVIEVSEKDFEQTPQTVPENIREYMLGVYKISNTLLSAINVDSIIKFLNKKN
ncbi:chemotaxis protein CheW [Pigmentibacter sp. JX0631]|uniref:chemotaxis protein CheW n=1 Tax=Pigmentibacter sp. JX0631 TaxID=2976982 RepID=UPI00246883AA|nr:chemotaxis protein CheW [Pigmentibacter sp. JX0631]WGL59130.1 chemotaxis protein CheW [Pigmentibacter sp. JX0631]